MSEFPGPPQGPPEAHTLQWPEALRARLRLLDAAANEQEDRTLSQIVSTCSSALDEWQSAADRLRSIDCERARIASLEALASGRLALMVDVVDRLSEEVLPEAKDDHRLHTEQSDLVVRLLGSFDVRVHGRRIVEWHSRRAQTVLQFLAVHRDRPVSRDALIDAVWPGLDSHHGRRRLHQAVYALRQTLGRTRSGQTLIQCTDGGYEISRHASVWTDVSEFEMLADRAAAPPEKRSEDEDVRQCEAAERAYGGDLLPDEDEAEWARTERERLRRRYVAVATRLARGLAERGEHARVVTVAERVLRLDCWHEGSLQLLMRAHLACGESAQAIRAFQRFEQLLDRDLGISPSAATMSVLAEVKVARTVSASPRP